MFQLIHNGRDILPYVADMRKMLELHRLIVSGEIEAVINERVAQRRKTEYPSMFCNASTIHTLATARWSELDKTNIEQCVAQHNVLMTWCLDKHEEMLA